MSTMCAVPTVCPLCFVRRQIIVNLDKDRNVSVDCAGTWALQLRRKYIALKLFVFNGNFGYFNNAFE